MSEPRNRAPKYRSMDALLDALHAKLLRRISKDASTGCWNWAGPVDRKTPSLSNRYGMTSWWHEGRQRTVSSHRAMWISLHGPTESDTFICHRCDNPLCINPRHLFASHAKGNTADMVAKGRHPNSIKTHCKRGHSLADSNMYNGTNGNRSCKVCQRGRHRISHGWSPDIAYSAPKIDCGYARDGSHSRAFKGPTTPADTQSARGP